MALDKPAIHNRLAKAKGQVGAIDRMIAEDEDAEKILVQINAVKSALHKVALMVTEDAILSRIEEKENEEEAKLALERFSALF